ncbi:MAG TPA: PAS domain-containing protein, partial [Anaeromyxobacteraceae bacterium]|nr:PAS domain-containing protein [Anaeromyxobacteraceae bacterium]
MARVHGRPVLLATERTAMITIPGYQLVAKLGEGTQSAIYRGFLKTAPERPLAIKVFRTIPLTERQVAHYRQKVEHLRVVRDSMLLTPESFDVKGGVPFVVQDYYEGLPLDEWARRQPVVTFDAFFTIACQLATALDKVHEAGIIHGGIKPHNILIDPATLEARLTGFVTPLDVRDVSHFIFDPAFISGTLAYTSPEQTGRIHHVAVFSSDLYSLGVVFYELLTRRLPFRSTDPLALIHQHLAEEAPPVHKVNPEIPAALGRIVAKLTLKQPEKRYQSGRGLFADLVRCKSEWEVGCSIGRFPLATQDRSRRVVFVSKMVGRDAQARAILDAYEQAAQGEFRSVLISGLPGIGKTRLIQELQQPIVDHRGYFTSGKFDIYQKNIPYSSIIQALRNLIRTFLTESQERIANWKRHILDVAGQNGRVLTDVIPELEALIGEQSAVPPLPPVEARNRFHNLFDQFLGCLASAESPLTLFIDDLQWCDAASFDFLQTLFTNSDEHPHLFLIGAYRHTEVDSSHPLAKLVGKVKGDKKPLEQIRLRPLEPRHCHEMVSYILDAPLAHTEALAAFLADLTEGNPLFVSESLSYLYNEDLLYVDDEMQWRWDLDRIRRSNMPSTVVALFSAKISRLPEKTIELLQTAACMGNTVGPQDLARVSDLALVDVFESLKPALGQGLVIENRGNLQFIHDRVQEAVLTAIAPERRRAIHWRVGQKLLAAVPAGADLEAVDNLFAIVSHLNLGRPAEIDRAETWRLADINFHAGKKALNALATTAASELFGKSKELLPADCWETQYEETFKIFKKAAKTELMCGRSDQSETLLADLLEHARTDLDKASALAEQTTSLSSIGNFIKAIETANRGLAYFDKALPDDPQEADWRRAALMAEIQAKHPDVWSEILHMPFTKDRKSKIELAFYSELIPDLYMSGLVPQLYLSAVQSTQHSLAGGMDESVIYSFSIMGLQLGEQGQFEQAFRYEDLARELAARYPNTFGATRGINGVVWCNMHSRSRPEEIVEYCLRGVQSGKSCGDLYNAGLCYGPLMWNLQVQGADLGAIEEYAHECQRFSEHNNLSFSVGLAEAMQAGWIAPMKKGYEPVPMEERIAQWEKDNHVAAAGSYYAHLALSHYYFGEHDKAAEALAGVKRYLSGLTDNVLKRQWYVFQALNALKLRERSVTPDSVLAEIEPLVSKVETWAALGPLLKPYLVFLHAERERVTGQFERARVLFLEAIDCAHSQRYLLLEGHLNECLGEMLLENGIGQAGPFLLEAMRLYRCCRAERKELRLRDRHPELVEAYAPLVQAPSAPVAEPPASETYALPQLDVGYLMRSALAISAEIEEKALLRRIMQTVVEASGAQRGYLLVADDGHLRVRAESHAGRDETVRTGDRRLEDTPDICSAMVRFVYRTGQRLVLADATQEGELKDNPQVRSLGLRSVLCLPIVKQGRLVGVFYLENRLAPGMFTPSGVQTTELLAAQAAISLENARLVEEMKRAEDTLARERERLAVTLHSIGDAVIATDTTGRVTMLNRVGEELTGWTQAEASGKSLAEVFQIVNEQTGAPAEDPVRKVLESGAVVGLANHTALIARDGSRRAIADSAAPIRGSSGEVLGVVLVFRNVTEAREAEEALQRSQRLLQLIIDSTPACISYLDRELRYRLVNQTYRDWFGLDPDQIKGKHVRELIADKVWEVTRPSLERALAGETIAFEKQSPYLGGPRWTYSTYTPDRSASGEVAGLVAHVVDISKLKEAETALRESEQRLAVTLHSIGDAVIATDTDSRVVTINRRAEELTGWSQTEAAGQRLAEVFRIVNEKTGAPAEDPVRKVIESGVIVGLANHTALVSRDGRRLTIADSAAPIRGRANEILGVVLVFRDITEARKAEFERDATIQLLRIVNTSADSRALIGAVTDFFQEQSGCEAVGVRLQEGDDYPYFEARGFAKEFVIVESRLCERDAAGNVALYCAG